ncbi:MAG: hypothetical protein JO252_04855, partial [Planctomycetaceae bacterium]|nr:hypothetical protein [Planctomycetaceae bacterium]
RRIRLDLDQPTRDKEKELFLLTDVPRERADARTLADAYRKRWRLETGQADSTSSDRWCEAPGAGYHRRYRAA